MNTYQTVNAIHATKNRAGFPRDLAVVCVVNQLGHVYGCWDGPDAQRKADEYLPQLSPMMQAPGMGGCVVNGKLIQ